MQWKGNPAPIRAAIFDLDGTLIDSQADIGLAMNRVLVAHGLPPHPIERYNRFIGSGARELAARVIGSAVPPRSAGAVSLSEDDALIARVLSAYRADYSENLVVHTVPYPEIVPLLQALERAGIALAVLSNKPHDMTRAIVAQLFPGIAFGQVFGQREGIPRKPDPSAALAIAESFGVQPAECTFVGDSRVDIQTAVAAGMPAIGVTWGFDEPDALREHGAQLLVNDVVALRTALLLGSSV